MRKNEKREAAALLCQKEKVAVTVANLQKTNPTPFSGNYGVSSTERGLRGDWPTAFGRTEK